MYSAFGNSFEPPDVDDLVTSRSAALLAAVALLAALVTGCGKTGSGRVVARKDPRTGPIRAFHVPDEGPLPPAEPRWDPPTAANGFEPVPRVERHP